MRKRLLISLIIIVFCMMPSQAAGLEYASGVDRLWDEAQQYGITPDTSLEQGISQLVSDARSRFKKEVTLQLDTACKLMAVALLCGLAYSGQMGAEGIKVVDLAGAICVTALTMTDMAAMIGLGRDTVGKIELFSESLLPVMAVLTAATGGVTSAALRQGATVFCSQILIGIIDGFLIPMVYAYVAVNCVCAAIGNPGLQKVAALIKSCVSGLLTAVLLLFVGYLTASGALSGSVDASAIKATRMAVSRAIPVVGGILADASESILIGAGILRGSVGIAGLLVVLAICITPFLRLAVQYLIYKVTAALCAAIAQPRLSQLIDAIGSAFGLVLGMTGACALVLLFSIVSAVSAVMPQ